MKIVSDVITPSGKRITPTIRVREFPDDKQNYYDLYHGDKCIGQLRIQFLDGKFFIKGMNNYSSDKLLSQRYHHVGKALHEVAFRASVEKGYEGSVELIAEHGSVPFHARCGYVNTDPEMKAQVDAELAASQKARTEGRSFRFSGEMTLNGAMTLSPEAIAVKRKLYSAAIPRKDSYSRVQVPAVVSHPVFTQVDFLVRSHQLSTKDAYELQTYLLHPSQPGDKTTWDIMLSTNALKALKLGYVSGRVIHPYFSQTHAEKLKYMFSFHGMYAFSRQFIGWQDCIPLDASALKFLLSDYGIKAMEEGFVKPIDLVHRNFEGVEFTEEKYLQLRCGEKTIDDFVIGAESTVKLVSML